MALGNKTDRSIVIPRRKQLNYIQTVAKSNKRQGKKEPEKKKNMSFIRKGYNSQSLPAFVRNPSTHVKCKKKKIKKKTKANSVHPTWYR